MKKIKITTSCSGFDFSFQQGQNYDVEDYIANDLIAVGYAEAAIKEKSESTAEDEKTVPEVEPAEAVIEKKSEPTVEDEKTASEVKPIKTRKTSKKDVSENAGA